MRILFRLLRFLHPHRWRVVLMAAAAIGIVACSVALPRLTGMVVGDVLEEGRRERLAPLCIAVIVIGILRFFFAGARRVLAGSVSLGVETDLRGRVFGHLSHMSLGYFDRMGVGQLMSRVTSDLQTVRFFLGYGLIFFAMHLLSLVVVTTLMLLIDPLLTLVALSVGPLLVAVAIWSSRRTNPVLIDAQQKVAELTQSAEESVVGVRVIKAFGQEVAQASRFDTRGSTAFERSMDGNRLQAFYQPLLGFLPLIGLAAVLTYGGILVIDDKLSLGKFIEFFLYLGLLAWPFRSIGMLIGQAQRAVAGGQRIFEVLDARSEVVEAPDAEPLPAGGGALRFTGVRLAFGDDARPVLDGLSLDIPAGRSVALIGATGSGKSTLAQLIPRFYDPDEGTVEIDGVDVRRLRLDDLRRAIGMVGQEPFLFSLPIRDNIAYGQPEATDEEIREAARQAQASAFIEALPDGYDTVIGERGYTLSGGQRQRIAIARAILARPRVLILDEATASVDASTEREINAALRTVMTGRTTIVIAHRPSTIALAEEIVVLDGGRIADRGTHEELYASSDLYREIHDQGVALPAPLPA